MKRALFLSPEVPYPVIGGGALRTASLFEYLVKHYSVDVITFRQPNSQDPRELFPAGMARAIQVIDLRIHSKSPAARAMRNLRRALQGRPPLLDRFSGFDLNIATEYELGIVEHFWCAPYAAQLRPHCRKLALDLHNIESVWHGTLADSEPASRSWLYRRFQHCAEVLEQKWFPQFDTLLVASQTDRERVPGLPVIIYPNAIPLVPVPERHERDAILFTGNLEYEPNRSAVLFFRDRIWPSLKQRWPHLTWEIAGKNDPAIRQIVQGDPRIQVTGPFESAVERIAQSKVAIAPLLAGSGTRFKILEAWAAATPVVSTTIGAEGLNHTAGQDILIANSPDSFVSAISILLENTAKRAQIGAAGRLLYERCYTWESCWAVLDKTL